MLQANIKEQLDRISRELMQLKKMLVYDGVIDKQKTEVAWKNLLNASKEISKKWKGPSAVEEIRGQREKKW
jgi:hypothetical protein